MRTWIIVEDEPDLYDTLMALTEARGVRPIGFTSVDSALELVEEIEEGRYAGELPELALLDIRLPNNNMLDQQGGIRVGERMRHSRALDGMKVVLMTAYRLSPKEEKKYVERTGAALLLYKPFGSEIISKLEAL